MKVSNQVRLIGNIGVFNTLILFDLSKAPPDKLTVTANEHGDITFSMNPGQYYISLQEIKRTVVLECGTVNIRDILDVKS